jgi:hypothetical protein
MLDVEIDVRWLGALARDKTLKQRANVIGLTAVMPRQ